MRYARDVKVWRRRRINFSIEQETARSTLNRRSLFVRSSAVFVIPSVAGYNVSLVRKSETLGYCYLIASRIALESSSRIHSITDTGKLPFLIKSS